MVHSVISALMGSTPLRALLARDLVWKDLLVKFKTTHSISQNAKMGPESRSISGESLSYA